MKNNKSPAITREDLRLGINNGVGLACATSVGYEQKTGVSAFAYGKKVYVVNGDKVTEFNKISYNPLYSQYREKIPKFGYSGNHPHVYADTNQDICVGKDHIFVIRDKVPDWDGDFKPPSNDLEKRDLQMDGKTDPSEYNVIDIYDLNGVYKGTKRIPILYSQNYSGTVYKELESISYDEANDSFSLYFSNSFTDASDNHTIVTGVKIDVPEDEAPNPSAKYQKLESNALA